MAGAKKDKNGLTYKQKRYAEARAAGKSMVDAYDAAGYGKGSNYHTKEVNAQRLEDTSESIKAHIAHLQKIVDNGGLMDTEQRKAALVEIYRDSTVSTKDRLKALDLLNRMSGDYIDKKEVSATVQGLTRSDRIEAMQDTLNTLKKAWNNSDGQE